MRLYVPLTLPRLAVAHRQGELDPLPLAAFAVTPALRAWCGSDDPEELEYAALGRAALASLRLLADDAQAPRRRVVVAVDVADEAVRSADEAVRSADEAVRSADKAVRPAGLDLDEAAVGQVLVDAAVPFRKAAAVHVDAAGAEAAVAAGAEALPAADAGDADAEATVEAAEEHDLLWYATQEVAHLLADGPARG
ncbi:hypothetical protein JJV70_14295 [Streptomyces sp. JJ66]|uniref:DUF6912 family protein n=1 Tax=Streptomyces sp. JJ66 TaxID=2803843 RepID=UPI001C5845A3|nr:hypothetical protein [Streptomyces sp. JJ66]MBW1603249.1 hypothetical protein [Streptomyces sp. JJ66]